MPWCIGVCEIVKVRFAMSAVLASFASIDAIKVDAYTRDELMVCRAFVLFVKRTARQGGFGQVAGRMMRETLGYKFDGMPVDAVLASMETPEFLRSTRPSWSSGTRLSTSPPAKRH